MRRLLLALAMLACATPAHARMHKLHELKITRANGSVASFLVEWARTEEEREYGLMGRKTVLPTEGMLFQYEEPGLHAFWMKDTVAPLDMIFFSPDGTITYIHPNAQPMDLTTIFPPGRQDTCAVLELGAGGAAKARLAKGDRMVFDGFPSACLPGPAQ